MSDKLGGKVIESGGYGCVFYPMLKCKFNIKPTEKIQYISKLMFKKEADDEYEIIKQIKQKLVHIPNYSKYFLIDGLFLCVPEKLSKKDLINYDKKCKTLKRRGLQIININDHLSKLRILNIPNGGIPVNRYVERNNSIKHIIILNNLLIDLLLNGITPMNKANVYHNDIKDTNVLIRLQNHEKFLRLIDWSLTFEYIPFKNNSLPKDLHNRSLQFNAPFSLILFSDDFAIKYNEYIQSGGKLTEIDLYPFCLKYLQFWLNKKGLGHYKFINEVMYILFSKDYENMNEFEKHKLIEKTYTIPFIINYITKILIQYTKYDANGSITLKDYLDNVFINSIDAWGFICIYIPILEAFYNNANNEELQIFIFIKNIFINYLYSPQKIEAININNLVKDLLQLDNLLKSAFRLENVINLTQFTHSKIYKNTSHNKTKKIFLKNSKPKSKTSRFKNFSFY